MTVKDKTKETASGQAYKVIGTRPLRPDGVDKVTGKAIYGADVQLPNTLHGAMLRSPHAHARIVSIDTSEAEVMPGVKAVVTAADLPDLDDIYVDLVESIVNLRYSSWKVLAHDKVLYHGHASRLWRRPARPSPKRRSRASRSSMRCCRRFSTSSRR